MSKRINFEYSASGICFDPKRLDAGDPDRSKIMNAFRLLKRASKLHAGAEQLEANAIASLYPLQLEIEADSMACVSIPVHVELTAQNTDITLDVVDGMLEMSYSARFSVPVGDDFTDLDYEQWESEGGFHYLGLTFAMDATKTDDGRASLAWSVEEE